jgi:hypothetical protein
MACSEEHANDNGRMLVNFHADAEQIQQFDKVAEKNKLNRTELLNAFIRLVTKSPSPVEIKVFPGKLVKMEKQVLIKTVDIKIDAILL